MIYKKIIHASSKPDIAEIKPEKGGSTVPSSREKQAVYRAELPPKYLTTKDLIIRGIIFVVLLVDSCSLPGQESSSK